MNLPIIPRSIPSKNGEKDKNSHGVVIRDIANLYRRLKLPTEIPQSISAINDQFPLRAPLSFVKQIDPTNPADPLLRQILPDLVEQREVAGFSDDPVGDLNNNVNDGVIHKYHNRVLLTVTGACAIHCRYCFRRNFPYSSENPRRNNWEGAIDYIRQHPEIEEVILSGGDPLMVETESLNRLVEQIEKIDHIKRLRIHSRIPVVAPEMITEQILTWIGGITLPVTMVIHSNHPNEISAQVIDTLDKLSQVGVSIFNQSVLLKGVNDEPHLLAELSKKLFNAGVQPYYLNLLDRASGTAHFEVDDKSTREIIKTLQTLLPGYMLPKVVRDRGGKSGKVVLGFESL